MTAPEPTAVERTIAEVIFANRHRATDCLTQAVVAAIRNLPPEQMAQLVDGEVERARRLGDLISVERVVTPWREVTGSATPARDLTPGARDV